MSEAAMGNYLQERRQHDDLVDLAAETDPELAQMLLDNQTSLNFAKEREAEFDPTVIRLLESDAIMLRGEIKRRRGEGSQFVSSLKENKWRKETLALQSWADFVATDHGNAPFTVEGIAPDVGLLAFHGRGKGGKTTLLIHAGHAISTGALSSSGRQRRSLCSMSTTRWVSIISRSC
jgi:hypothetical protein